MAVAVVVDVGVGVGVGGGFRWLKTEAALEEAQVSGSPEKRVDSEPRVLNAQIVQGFAA